MDTENVAYLGRGKNEWAPEKKPMSGTGIASIMSPQASLATNRTQPGGFQASYVAAASGRKHDQTGGVGDRHAHSKMRMSLSILITECRVFLESNYYGFFLLFFFFLRFASPNIKRIQETRGACSFVQTNKSGSSPNSRMTLRQLIGCDLTGTPLASMPTAMRFAQTSWMSSRACRQLPNELASLPTFARRARQKSTSACVAARQPVMVIGNMRARSSGEEHNAYKAKSKLNGCWRARALQYKTRTVRA